MKLKWNTNTIIIVLLTVLAVILAVITIVDKKQEDNVREAAKQKETLGLDEVRYNTTDIAVIINIDNDNKQLTLQSIDNDKSYVVTYSGATYVLNENGDYLTMTQLKAGQLVDAYYMSGVQKLIKIQECTKAWKNEIVTNVVVDVSEETIKLGSNYYQYKDMIVVSNNTTINPEEISQTDIISAYGIGNTIYSAIVEKGHGYIRLINDENFIGGIIQISSSIVKPISKDMLILVPEGENTFFVSKDKIGGNGTLTIRRNQETVLNLIDYQGEVENYGTVRFTVTPEKAAMYIDGAKVDHTQPLEITLGTHSMLVLYSGYVTTAKTFSVTSSYQNIEVSLNEGETKKEDETENETNKTYKVTVKGPTEVEVYLDGVSKGKAQITFETTKGSHLITLRKDGCITKTYTIYVSGDDESEFTFADLVEY